jgi:hypothetical protein
MNKYEFNVKLFGSVTFEVQADSREEAERIVRDTMDSINVKDLKLKETSKNNISIDSSNVFYETHERNKKEQER